jgi:hypothetical protein
MDQLWAIRKDFDPFPARVFINYNVWAIFRCTAYLCPYCPTPFKIVWGQKAAFLGSGERTCWRCRKKFWDNSQEWPEMSSEDQRLLLLPISVIGWLGGALVVGGLAFYGARSGVDIVAGLFVTLFLLVPLILWFAFRWWQVARSIRRYNARGVKELS